MLPEGIPTQVEGHHVLIAREGLAPELRELLVLIPKGNHKTTLAGAAMDWHLLTVPNANGYIGAADRIQADEMYRFMCHFVQSEPELEERLLVRNSTREIRSLVDQGFARVLASDDSKQGGKRQGLNPTFFDLDELHAHENDNLYTDGRSGLFKRNGRLWTISTAGWDRESVLGLLRANFLAQAEHGGTVETGLRVLPEGGTERHPDGRLTICRTADGRSVALMWEARDDDDISDPAVVKLCNPASTVTVESIEDAMQAPGITPWAFARYRANRWTLGFDSWLPQKSWSALADPASVPPVDWRTWEGATTDAIGEPTPEFRDFIGSLFEPGSSVVGAMDMARYRDTAALGLIHRRADSKKVVRRVIWRSGGQDNPIRYEWPKQAIRLLHEMYELVACGFDPKWFDQSAEELEGEGIAMEAFAQSNERTAPADADLRQEIILGEFVHDGDPLLEAHMMAGRAVDVGRQMFRVDRQEGKSAPPIDACRAVSMANAIEKFADPSSMYDSEDVTI